MHKFVQVLHVVLVLPKVILLLAQTCAFVHNECNMGTCYEVMKDVIQLHYERVYFLKMSLQPTQLIKLFRIANSCHWCPFLKE
jgi:hypothetical protein